MADYGRRTCLVCGKEFSPQYPQNVCCSKECQKQRDKANGQKWHEKYRLTIQKRMASLEQAVVLLEKLVCHVHGLSEDEMRDLYKKLLAEEDTTAPEPEPKPEPKPVPPTLHVCERMSLRTTSPLPCGERVECFNPQRCDRVPTWAKPVTENAVDKRKFLS